MLLIKSDNPVNLEIFQVCEKISKIIENGQSHTYATILSKFEQIAENHPTIFKFCADSHVQKDAEVSNGQAIFFLSKTQTDRF